ncbi:hypothetical protein ACFSQT_35550 [Mesorhizobium calcicola]|uniref:Metallo-beta-lactamase domain-containing protein n=1 Tax=Mesorhizobium calcicola TaxID=1300310 RepID=A0ABW4WP65_9HYPH
MGLVPLRPVLGLPHGKPVVAVATHIHVDHVGGLSEFETRGRSSRGGSLLRRHGGRAHIGASVSCAAAGRRQVTE